MTNALDSMSAQSVDLLANLKGKPAIYHCLSRIVNRAFLPPIYVTCRDNHGESGAVGFTLMSG